MALNAVSEKVFVILWFWFLLLIIINIVNMIFLVLMAVKSHGIRKLFIRRVAGSKQVSSVLFFISIFCILIYHIFLISDWKRLEGD